MLAALNRLLCPFCLLCLSTVTNAQVNNTDTAGAYTLDQCVTYALKHEPMINQAMINQAIVRASNAIATAGWLPQVGVAGTFTHYFSLPTSFIKDSSGKVVNQKAGIVNTFNPTLAVSQTIFNPALIYAAHAAPVYNRQAQQITDSSKIAIVAAVSKSFYSLLLTLEQINVLMDDTARLNKNVSDTYHQFVGGVVDKTDYDEAVISLNNSLVTLRQAVEAVRPQYAQLKQVMGYPPTAHFNVVYDTAQMQQDIAFDTTRQLQFEKRIEYQVLQTAKALQRMQADYYRKSWLPTVGAFFDYEYEFEHNTISGMFDQSYPFSYAGLQVSIPIFTGLARVNNIKRARLQYDLLDWTEVELKSQIYSEYTSALAAYKSNLYNLSLSKENVALAQESYDIVKLQYQQGVVAYLNVITAESNLRTSEITYQNSLFQLLSSKIDLEQAMGIIMVK
ncbi:MAG TPA: TolC family protein [Puia sp.]|nr:TolC family protein [Puia sp.]